MPTLEAGYALEAPRPPGQTVRYECPHCGTGPGGREWKGLRWGQLDGRRTSGINCVTCGGTGWVAFLIHRAGRWYPYGED